MQTITHKAFSPMEGPMSRLLTLALTAVLAAIVMPSSANAQGTEEVRYYHADAVGSVRLVTDANGQVTTSDPVLAIENAIRDPQQRNRYAYASVRRQQDGRLNPTWTSRRG
jgi:hypothetical protein